MAGRSAHPHSPPAAPTGAAGAGVWSICRGLGATGLWDRGLGPGSALLPGGEPHVLEGWWEKESTPSCLHLAVNPRKSPHTAPRGGDDCVSLTHPRWGQEVGVPPLSSSVYRKMERLAHQRKESLHPGSCLL